MRESEKKEVWEVMKGKDGEGRGSIEVRVSRKESE